MKRYGFDLGDPFFQPQVPKWKEMADGKYVEFSNFQKRDELVRELVEALELAMRRMPKFVLLHSEKNQIEGVIAKAKAIDAEETRS